MSLKVIASFLIIWIEVEAVSKQFFYSLPLGSQVSGEVNILHTNLMDSIIW